MKKKVLLIWDNPEGLEIYIEGGFYAQVYKYKNNVTAQIFTDIIDIYYNSEPDLFSHLREWFEFCHYPISMSLFDVVKEVIIQFKIDPLNCEFININWFEYEDEYIHLVNLVIFHDEIFFVLDLFSGAGGSAFGLHLALKDNKVDHQIIGVDNREMPDYPFYFIQKNVFKLKRKFLRLFDFYWSSPPCQAYVSCNLHKSSNHPRLISKTRETLLKLRKPFVIENIQKAPLRQDLMLCGTMFNLGVFRHRFFEVHGFTCYQPTHPVHKGRCGDGRHFTITSGGPWRTKRKKGERARMKYYYGDYEDWCNAMGTDWIRFEWVDHKSRKSIIHPKLGPILPSGHPLSEAIPPAFTEYIMGQFLKQWITLDKWIRN